MKTITKLTFVAAILAVIGTNAALAGDSQLENRLAQQRRDAARTLQPTTIAVYSGQQAVGQRSAMRDDRADVRFEWRTNSRGQGYGIYVPAK